MIRPQPAAWFEIITAPEDARDVLESIGAAACAEIEPVTRHSAASAAQQDGAMPDGGIYARITGWTSNAVTLAAHLERGPARSVVHFPEAPKELQAPLILRNPAWAQPFEIFARLAGMPGRFGADPSQLLVFVAPILFGYMFGDVFQGLALVVIGLALQRRWPMLRLLVAGGVVATAFGFVFGSAGSVRGVIHPLWVDPLDQPLPVLLAPIALGGVLLTLGLALRGLEAYWRGRPGAWLRSDAGFLAVYLGILLAVFHPAGQVLILLGIGIHIVGRLRQERRIGAAFAALGELLEKLAQILINTLSFVRVGAFALAHAGLSSGLVSVASVAQDAGNCVGYAFLLLAGNALIIVVEVFVASIQTTRLVLFEFFTRFFESTGREFHPSPPPSKSP